MFACDNNNEARLPDIVTYGGDTTPWSVTLVRQNGNPYNYNALEGCTCTLTFMPFSITNGIHSQINLLPPVLTKTGQVTSDPSGIGTALFTFQVADTIELKGKYVYQVEVDGTGGEKRVGQGFVTIKQNINQA